MAETSIKTGQPDLAKLLKRTKFHPKGRVQIDEATGDIVNPKNPVIEKDVPVNTLVDGKEVTRLIDRQGGHVTGPNTVWRIAMCKPLFAIGSGNLEAKCPQEMYFKMSEMYARKKAVGKGRYDFRPSLELAEAEDYAKWLKETGKKHPIAGEFEQPEEKKVA